MDITLLHMLQFLLRLYNQSFNPCFNGYYTFTSLLGLNYIIVMWSFNPCFNGYYTFTKPMQLFEQDDNKSFNPCFNGYYTFTGCTSQP